MSAPAAPKDIQETLTELGFELRAWDGGDGAISGHGQEFIGSYAEVRAYLTAWSSCLARATWQSDQDKAAEENSTRLVRTGIVLSSNVAIEPAQSAQITARPQVTPFRGDRVVVLDECAEAFDIDDLKVGNRSQFPQTMSMPAKFCAARISSQALFGCEITRSIMQSHIKIAITEPALGEFGMAWMMDTCQNAQDLVTIVTNRSNQPARFVALIVGRGSR